MAHAKAVRENLSIDLGDRVAVVFGAGSVAPGWSNGRASAVAYARCGARVACIDLDRGKAEETAGIVDDAGGPALPLQADVLDFEQVCSVVDTITAEWGRIDILHNNVGGATGGDVTDIAVADWTRDIEINLGSAFRTCKAILPTMLEQSAGVITNISSILAVAVGRHPAPAYGAGKAGLEQFTRFLASRYAANGIRANAIRPGLLETPLVYSGLDPVADAAAVRHLKEERDATSPTGKMGNAWHVAETAAFLASDAASYINGAVLPVDGGLGCRLSEARSING